eukprot:10946189-Prorocentrum_lima.AAC.1
MVTTAAFGYGAGGTGVPPAGTGDAHMSDAAPPFMTAAWSSPCRQSALAGLYSYLRVNGWSSQTSLSPCCPPFRP